MCCAVLHYQVIACECERVCVRVRVGGWVWTLRFFSSWVAVEIECKWVEMSKINKEKSTRYWWVLRLIDWWATWLMTNLSSYLITLLISLLITLLANVFTDCCFDWLIDWYIDYLADRLSDWLTYWLTDSVSVASCRSSPSTWHNRAMPIVVRHKLNGTSV